MQFKYNWFKVGDISGATTIIFDNLTVMAFVGFILTIVFGFPNAIVYNHVIPGLAIGVIVGNILCTYLGFKLAKTEKKNVVAFPFGLDAPSAIGLSTCIVGPAFLLFKSKGMDLESAALLAWYIGCACIFFLGLIKLILAIFINQINRWIPPLALLSGIAGVAVAMIGFFPLINVFQFPIVGLPVLGLIFVAIFAGFKLPKHVPIIPIAIIVGALVYYVVQYLLSGSLNFPLAEISFSLPHASLKFFEYWPQALKYFSIALPFGFLVVFGTLSVTESAVAMGDNYSARSLMVIDGISTLVIALFGGISQTTPYAGYPAYKKMDASAGYLIINAAIIALGALFGIINYIIAFLPDAVLAPVLLYVAMEITMQAFYFSEKKHYPVVIFALFPSIARLLEIKLSANSAMIPLDQLTKLANIINNGKFSDIMAIVCLGNGFIISGTLWAACLYFAIEKKIVASFSCSLILATCAFLGIIHSPNLDGSMHLYYTLTPNLKIIPLELALGYLFFGLATIILYQLNKIKK